MADDLDLKILITALLNSKGFEEAQAKLKGMKDTSDNAVPATDRLTKGQKELARELGGTRGAAADLTRIMLQNIGVTGPMGEAAKAAGAAMNLATGAAGGLGLAVNGLVLVAALLAPKLIEWAKGTKETDEATKDLKESIVGMLPELEEYMKTVPRVTEELRALYQVQRDQAHDDQKKRIADLTKTVNENEEKIAKLRAGTAAYVETLGKGEVIVHAAVAAKAEDREKADELAIATGRLKVELEAVLAAEADGVILGEQIRAGLDGERERREKLKKALEDQKKAQRELAADQLQLERDIQKENIRRQEQERKDRIESRKKHDQDIQTAAERILALDREHDERMKEIEDAKAAKRQEVADGIALSAQAAATIAGMFTKNKAINIAAAIADAYAAGVATLKATAGMGPWVSVPAMAMVIATGLANVERIREASPGFDDPMSDMLAGRLGRKSAQDFLRLWGEGFYGGLQDRGSGGGTTNNYHSTTINRGVSLGPINGVVGSKTEFRRFLQREITAANRAERRSSI
jgi:hypothetical protein